MSDTTMQPVPPLDATTDELSGVVAAIPDDVSSITGAPAFAGVSTAKASQGVPPDGSAGRQAATGPHLPWRRIVAAVVVLAMVAALAAFGLGQRSQLASRTRSLADARTELASTKATLDSTKASLDSTKASLDSTKATLESTKTELATMQGQVTALTAERERLTNQLGLSQADLTRVTSIRDAMKTQLASAPKAIDNALNCWGADEATALAALAYLNDEISAAQLGAVLDAHNVGHSSGTCATAWDDLIAWHDGLRAFGISG